MDKQIIFKTSAFGGFEKKAVLDYIYQLNEDTGNAQAALRGQLAATTGEAQSLGEELSRSGERIKTLQQNLDNSNAELVGERARTVELGNLNEGLREELERDRERLRQREQELELLIAENRSLKAKNDEFAAKQGELDESVARIGQLMLVARADADAMIKSAEAESRQTLTQTRQETEDMRRDAEEQTEATLSDAARRARELLADAETRSATMLASAEARSADMMDKSRLSLEDASGRLRDLRSEMGQVTNLIGHLFAQLKEKAGEVDGSIEDAFAVLGSAGSEPMEEDGPVDEMLLADTPELPGEGGDTTDSFFRSAAEV